MINNRLFKKINSIFWGILSWLPVFISIYFAFCYAISLDVSDITNFTYGDFYEQLYNGITSSLGAFNNNLTILFVSFIDAFDVVGNQPFSAFILVVLSWFCMVQVFRLLAYVFVWFINFIISLFDLMTFNRKGDN